MECKANPWATRSFDELEHERARLAAPPTACGRVELVVRRLAPGERELPDEVELTVQGGVVGDRWVLSPEREWERQLTLMNARYAELVACGRDRWALCGDNFLVDYDLSEHNAPAGTRLQMGDAIIEVTATEHLGCAKFRERFGPGALRWVNVKSLLALRLRGVNARVLSSGIVRVGDPVTRLPTEGTITLPSRALSGSSEAHESGE